MSIIASLSRFEVIGVVCAFAFIYVLYIGLTYKGEEHEGVELPPGLYRPPSGEDHVAIAGEFNGLVHHALAARRKPAPPPPPVKPSPPCSKSS